MSRIRETYRSNPSQIPRLAVSTGRELRLWKRRLFATILLGSTFVTGCRTTATARPDTVVSIASSNAEMVALVNEIRLPGSAVIATQHVATQQAPLQSAQAPTPAQVATPQTSRRASLFRFASTQLGGPAFGGPQLNGPENLKPELSESHADHAVLLDELDQALATNLGAKAKANEVLEYGLVPQADSPLASLATQRVHKPFSTSELPVDQWMLTESEMLSVAMSNSPVLRPLGVRVVDNPDAVTTRYDVAIAATDPFFGPQAALADFDAQWNASVTAQNNDRVFNNAILGGAAQELVQDATTFTTGWQKRTLSGATIELGADHFYDKNNRSGNLFPNYWETQWQAGIRQPLLQGAGRNFNLIAGPSAQPGFNFSNGIVIAKLNVKVTEADFQIKVRDFVRDLYQTYWDLKQRYQTFEQIQTAERLALRTWQTVKAKRQASVSGGDAHREAQARARYYAFRRQLRSALDGDGGQGGLYVIERRLRYMMGLPIVDGRLLRPTDEAVSVRFTFDFDQLVSRAIANRTEVHRQSLRLRKQELRLIAAKNFMLPQLDLIGRYRLRGFGDDLIGGGGAIWQCLQGLLLS